MNTADMKKSEEAKAWEVNFYASGYVCTFKYLVVAKNLEAAKTQWDGYVKKNRRICYAWEKSAKGAKNHYGGYVSWKAAKRENREPGCYELPRDNWATGSDHLRD